MRQVSLEQCKFWDMRASSEPFAAPALALILQDFQIRILDVDKFNASKALQVRGEQGSGAFFGRSSS